MLDFLIVFCSCASREEAERLGEAVVERRLAACANILPGVMSIYRWKGEVERASEHLLLMKTTAEGFALLRDALLEMHSYKNPEIVGVPLSHGADKYLGWIQENVGRSPK